MGTDTLDFDRAISLLNEAARVCSELQGTGINTESNHKEKASVRAQTSRLNLLAAHFADAARLEITNQYYRFRGEAEVPTVQLLTNRSR